EHGSDFAFARFLDGNRATDRGCRIEVDALSPDFDEQLGFRDVFAGRDGQSQDDDGQCAEEAEEEFPPVAEKDAKYVARSEAGTSKVIHWSGSERRNPWMPSGFRRSAHPHDARSARRPSLRYPALPKD